MTPVDDDERYLLIDGRRWRRSDPAIPAALRQELVDELMDARRAVKGAGDDTERTASRARVDAAKRALGERGRPWWEDSAPEDDDERLEAAVVALARHRSPKTLCPSDAARIAGGERWRSLMPRAREVAKGLAGSGVVVITQKGSPVDPDGEWWGDRSGSASPGRSPPFASLSGSGAPGHPGRLRRHSGL